MFGEQVTTPPQLRFAWGKTHSVHGGRALNICHCKIPNIVFLKTQHDGKGNELEILSYPNPVNNVLNVSYSNIKSTIINFTIVDVLGKVVLSIEDNSSYSIERLSKSINVSTLENGNYFLKISSLDIVKSIPFVVSH